jgi:Na+/H+-dicarboxylate symporter/ABC-type amino acid transport substrate-binding protein
MPGERRAPKDPLFRRILIGLGFGALAGIVLGDLVRPLEFVANGFVRLLQVNVLPYLLGSLIASLGSRGPAEMKVIARYGISLLLLAWAVALTLVVLSPLAWPSFTGAVVIGPTEPAESVDWLDLYIPANLFHALTNNLIPAVVLFGILAGLALGQMASERKQVLLNALGAFNETMARVSRMILRVTPIGLFAIAAVTAGTVRVQELLRLQIWFHFYAGVTLLMSFWFLPGLVALLTPIPYTRFLHAVRNAVVTAAAAGDALVVLPLVVEAGKELLSEGSAAPAEADRAVSVAVPLLYNFPHAGKVLSLAFLPFAAWFSGAALGSQQLVTLASAGLLSVFGSINAAIPFLLDLLRLPSDLFELFTVSGVINSHMGSMTAAMHAAALSVLVASAMLGRFHVPLRRLGRFGVVSAAILAVFLGGTRALYTWLLPPEPSGLETLSSFRLRPPLVAATIQNTDVPAPATSSQPGNRLQDVQSRGVLRVGYFDDAVPWSFVNAGGDLVGYDIEAAHRLAARLGVALEFIRAARPTLAADLSSGRFDICMSGYAGTVSRAQRMELSRPYSSEHVGFLVRDHLRNRFATMDTLAGGSGLTIAIPRMKDGRDLMTSTFPAASAREFDAVDQAIGDPAVDAVLMTLERASYFSRVHPEYAAVRPEDLRTAVITVYAVPAGEIEMRNLVDLWIETRRASGDLDEAYEYWIRGRALTPKAPRWSVLRALLGSGDR